MALFFSRFFFSSIGFPSIIRFSQLFATPRKLVRAESAATVWKSNDTYAFPVAFFYYRGGFFLNIFLPFLFFLSDFNSLVPPVRTRLVYFARPFDRSPADRTFRNTRVVVVVYFLFVLFTEPFPLLFSSSFFFSMLRVTRALCASG